MEISVNKAKQLTVNDMNGVTPPPTPKQAIAPQPKKSGGKNKLVLWVILGIVLLSSFGTAGYFYKKYQDVNSDPKAAQEEKNQVETDRVMVSLKKTLLITEADAPTVARVEDPEKLKSSNQEFYKDIQKGDYLIIFPKRAIIYRESEDQIINVAPIINTSDLKSKEGTTPASTEATKE